MSKSRREDAPCAPSQKRRTKLSFQSIVSCRAKEACVDSVSVAFCRVAQCRAVLGSAVQSIASSIVAMRRAKSRRVVRSVPSCGSLRRFSVSRVTINRVLDSRDASCKVDESCAISTVVQKPASIQCQSRVAKSRRVMQCRAAPCNQCEYHHAQDCVHSPMSQAARCAAAQNSPLDVSSGKNAPCRTA